MEDSEGEKEENPQQPATSTPLPPKPLSGMDPEEVALWHALTQAIKKKDNEKAKVLRSRWKRVSEMSEEEKAKERKAAMEKKELLQEKERKHEWLVGDIFKVKSGLERLF